MHVVVQDRSPSRDRGYLPTQNDLVDFFRGLVDFYRGART